jgi:hypothetical protein
MMVQARANLTAFAIVIAASVAFVWSGLYYRTYAETQLIARAPYAVTLCLHLWMSIFATAVAALMMRPPESRAATARTVTIAAAAIALILTAAVYTRMLFDLGPPSDNPSSHLTGSGSGDVGFGWAAVALLNIWCEIALAVALIAAGTIAFLNRKRMRPVTGVARVIAGIVTFGALLSCLNVARFLIAHVSWPRYGTIYAFYGMAGSLLVLSLAVGVSGMVVLLRATATSAFAFWFWFFSALISLLLTFAQVREAIAAGFFESVVR